MRCVVTAGPTYEPLDSVRRLTNFSTGRLGSELANSLAARGHSVTLLLGEQATYRSELRADKVEVFNTTADLESRLRGLAGRDVDAVFHAAAVSDFKFGTVWFRSGSGQLVQANAGKISTSKGVLLAELLPTAKLINRLRDWFPSSVLVGWKFEVEGTRADVIALARKQVLECRTDACVANGPGYGAGFGIITAVADALHVAARAELFDSLAALMCRHGLTAKKRK